MITSRVVETTGIVKIFNRGREEKEEIVANQDVNCFFLKGKMNMLMGENGSGKSTFVSILSGITNQDSGSVAIFSQNSGLIKNATLKERRKFIKLVPQNIPFVSSISALENIMVDYHSALTPNWFFGSFRGKREVFSLSKKIISEFGLSIDLNSYSFSFFERLQIWIIRVLLTPAEVIIFDEPVIGLSRQEKNYFLSICSNIVDNGRTVIIISHSFDEILRNMDVIHIFRKGRISKTYFPSEGLNINDLKSSIFGKDTFKKYLADPRFFSLQLVKDTLVLEKGGRDQEVIFSLDSGSGIKLEIKKGEIIGITGVFNQDFFSFVDTLTGKTWTKNRGIKMIFNNEDVSNLSKQDWFKRGIIVVPSHQEAGMFFNFSCLKNFSVYFRDQLNFFFTQGQLRNLEDRFIKCLNQFMPFFFDKNFIHRKIYTFSFGNRQRLLLATILNQPKKLFILDNPTANLDWVGSINLIQAVVTKSVSDNTAFVFFSSDRDFLLTVSEILVVVDGSKIVGISSRGSINFSSEWIDSLVN